MSGENSNEVHMGADCKLVFQMEVKEQNLLDAEKIIELESNWDELEKDFSVEKIENIVSEVNKLAIYNESDSKVVFESNYLDSVVPKKLLNSKFSTAKNYLIGSLFGGLLVFLNNSDDTISNKVLDLIFYLFLAYLAISPLIKLVFSKTLISKKFLVPNWGVKWPDIDKATKGTFIFEVEGRGFVQLFITAVDELDAVEKSKHVLGLDSDFKGSTIELAHFISLNELTGIYLYDQRAKQRISQNLISPIRLKYYHSLYKYILAGETSIAWKINLGLILVLLIFKFLL